MAAPELVIVDTCICVQFFSRPQSRDKKAVDALLDDDRAALVGPLLTEILLGFRRSEQADWVASMLRGVHFLQISWDDWRSAAHFGRQLSANGHHLPLSDLVLAAVALDRSVDIYTTDPRFDLFSGLGRFVP